MSNMKKKHLVVDTSRNTVISKNMMTVRSHTPATAYKRVFRKRA